MESKLSWDDIPSLEGLVVDWEYKSEIALDKRAFVRIAKEEMSQLYESGEIIAKLATAKQTYDGHLFDISAGGIALSLPVLLAENLPVKVGFFLGTTRIVSVDPTNLFSIQNPSKNPGFSCLKHVAV